MTLRMRLIASVLCVLLSSLACGSAIMGWHAAISVRTELQAALGSAVRAVGDGMARLPETGEPGDALRHLVATFDGNRHVQATLLDASERQMTASELYRPARPAPAWFHRLAGPTLPEQRINAPSPIGSILLRADSRNEVSEVWSASVDAMTVLGGFALTVTLLICAIVQHALRPLERIARAFSRIGNGDYSDRVTVSGPAEMMHLANGLNAMSQQLTAMAAQNRRLNERLLTLQAEERAELARDLHDEVGPLLFAVNMTAATIERLAATRSAEIPSHARSIQDAVACAQAHMRILLGRLRPVHSTGLETAIRRLAAFWHNHRPDIAIDVRIDADLDRMGDDLKEAAYRIVQEGLSNAVRHGRPRQVEVIVALDDRHSLRVEVRDDGTGLPVTGPDSQQDHLGLVGIRERVMALAGTVSIAAGPSGCGAALVVHLPWQEVVEA